MQLKCIKDVYEFNDEDFETQFKKEKSYPVQWKSKDDEWGYSLRNELDIDHYVGVSGDKWFDEHFILLTDIRENNE